MAGRHCWGVGGGGGSNKKEKELTDMDNGVVTRGVHVEEGMGVKWYWKNRIKNELFKKRERKITHPYSDSVPKSTENKKQRTWFCMFSRHLKLEIN